MMGIGLRGASRGAAVAALLVLASCSGAPATAPGSTLVGPSGSASAALRTGAEATPAATATQTATLTAATSPTPSFSPSPAPQVAAGSEAWVAVNVATGWRSASSPRAVDAPAIANPPRIREWLAALTVDQQAALIGLMDTQMLMGERVLVVAIAGGWAQVAVPDQPSPLDSRGYPVWVPLAQLTAIAPPAADLEARVVQPTAWLRDGSGVAIAEVSFATRLPVVGGDAARVQVGLPGGGEAWFEAASVSVESTGPGVLAHTGDSIVGSARAFIGLRYLWSGTSGFGFDCSGLAHIVYRAYGITLPRDADAQAVVGLAVGQSALQPGDLVFFARNGAVHHVAIYAGAGQVIDAPDIAKPVRLIALSAISSGEQLTFRRVLP